MEREREEDKAKFYAVFEKLKRGEPISEDNDGSQEVLAVLQTSSISSDLFWFIVLAV